MLTPWPQRIPSRFPAFCRHPMAQRHAEFWAWRDSITTERPRPFVAIWPRGGAKSTTAELFVCDAGESLLRPYAVYVCATQDQANKHVASVATMFDLRGMGRAVNKYGASKGWRRNRLSCSNGFTVDALGFDTAARGIKLDENRPGLLVFDDVDGKHDSEKTVLKKVEILTDTFLPALAENGIVLFMQNLIHRDSIATQLSNLAPDIRADFLVDRLVSGPFPALENLRTQVCYDETIGANRTLIMSGSPTWEGQDLAACQKAIDTYGLAAFLRESQHEVFNQAGVMFQRDWFEIVLEVPRQAERVRRWDMAATEGGGDYTAGVLMARVGHTYFVEDVVRFQHGPSARDHCIRAVAAQDLKNYAKTGGVRQIAPQDPGSAGLDAARHFRALLTGHSTAIERETGDKTTRADPFASEAGQHNVKIQRAPWNEAWLRELERFPHAKHDDQVDATAGAYNRLAKRRDLAYVIA